MEKLQIGGFQGAWGPSLVDGWRGWQAAVSRQTARNPSKRLFLAERSRLSSCWQSCILKAGKQRLRGAEGALVCVSKHSFPQCGVAGSGDKVFSPHSCCDLRSAASVAIAEQDRGWASFFLLLVPTVQRSYNRPLLTVSWLYQRFLPVLLHLHIAHRDIYREKGAEGLQKAKKRGISE
jgi:hypothetical protein